MSDQPTKWAQRTAAQQEAVEDVLQRTADATEDQKAMARALIEQRVEAEIELASVIYTASHARLAGAPDDPHAYMMTTDEALHRARAFLNATDRWRTHRTATLTAEALETEASQ